MCAEPDARAWAVAHKLSLDMRNYDIIVGLTVLVAMLFIAALILLVFFGAVEFVPIWMN
jgi:hypothetical protein